MSSNYNLIYSGAIDEKSKKVVDEKLENITISNNSRISKEYFSKFYENIKFLNLLTIFINKKKISISIKKNIKV